MSNSAPKPTDLLKSKQTKRSKQKALVLFTRESTAIQLSTLLRLPNELRDLIYERVLIHDRTIRVDASLKLPGLFGTCLQTRAETVSIYWRRNTFEFDTYDFDLSHVDEFDRRTDLLVAQAQGMGTRTLVLHCGRDSDKVWTNLEAWCKDIFERRQARPTPVPNEPAPAVVSVTDTAHNLSGKMTWIECQQVLSSVRQAAGGADANWLRALQ